MTSHNTSAAQSTKTNLLMWLGIAMIVIIFDQLTKISITALLSYQEHIAITPFFNLILLHNPGAAFSFLADASGWQRYFFSGLGIIAAIIIIVMLKRHPTQRLFCFSLALILGGAIGNIIDRMIYGYVIDFLDVYINNWHWPAFNIADSAICIGAVLLIWDEFKRVK